MTLLQRVFSYHESIVLANTLPNTLPFSPEHHNHITLSIEIRSHFAYISVCLLHFAYKCYHVIYIWV